LKQTWVKASKMIKGIGRTGNKVFTPKQVAWPCTWLSERGPGLKPARGHVFHHCHHSYWEIDEEQPKKGWRGVVGVRVRYHHLKRDGLMPRALIWA